MKAPSEKEAERFETLMAEHRKVRAILKQFESLSRTMKWHVIELLAEDLGVPLNKSNVEANPK